MDIKNNVTKIFKNFSHKKYLKIEGGKFLKGNIEISGAKNSALVLMAASILSKGEINLFNVPQISDVSIMSKLLITMGINIKSNANQLTINTKEIIIPPQDLFFDLCNALRVSFFCIGPILARFGKAKIPLPGGCSIGSRPIDEHIDSLKKLGVIFQYRNNYVIAKVINPQKRLLGSSINFKCKSVGATETLLMAASLAKGKTILNNAAEEPEIVDLANMLNLMGARIKGAGSECITIEGVESLKGCDYTVIPDRIEAGTFLLAAAITRSTISLFPCEPNHLKALINKLELCGCKFEYSNFCLKIIPNQILNSVDITTGPFPDFPTDLQAPFMALMATTNGISKIKETVFENRMHHVKELNHMGAKITVKNNIAKVIGVKKLQGREVTGSDLRATAALAIAGLSANGKTIVKGLEHLERGYENFSEKFQEIGASILKK
ncbi:UDP-N-acetylglucosamine enolpyruvyl transferase [Prochlorococcus marinus str. MIT 9215]|uniref:UDP-N-acetylglucosamine 1-carboxyvinyltransferase n=1 Tax=Prochlorococcus marinus (strain MIT 9215) TaxID=93060 RepID=A8G227_PROM2|nr:UDP-N-acetylglucosamine 1-carboxyvinyltransferase [Prochlorococcus marinus]ABV49658.1 UDP-N-acetylglucosamine enolpyruvyl transferase [Prochlorococcus marinus str. MIT 9215]